MSTTLMSICKIKLTFEFHKQNLLLCLIIISSIIFFRIYMKFYLQHAIYPDRMKHLDWFLIEKLWCPINVSSNIFSRLKP